MTRKIYLIIFLILLVSILYFSYIVPYYTSKYECSYTKPLGTSGIADRSRIEYESNKTLDSLVNRVFLETGVQLNKLIERVKNEGYTSTVLVSPFETEKKHISLSSYIVNESIKFIEKKNNVSVFKADFYICIAITKYNYIYPFGDYCHIYKARVNGLMRTEIDPKLILNIYKGLELEYIEDDIDLRNY